MQTAREILQDSGSYPVWLDGESLSYREIVQLIEREHARGKFLATCQAEDTGVEIYPSAPQILHTSVVGILRGEGGVTSSEAKRLVIFSERYLSRLEAKFVPDSKLAQILRDPALNRPAIERADIRWCIELSRFDDWYTLAEVVRGTVLLRPASFSAES